MIKVILDKELDAAIYTVEGDVEYSEICDVINKYYKGPLTKYTIGDYSKANPGKHLTAEETKQLGLQVQTLSNARPNGFDLLVVPGIVQYGVARVYRAYSEFTGTNTPKLTLKIFKKLEDAVAFIRQNEISDKTNR